MISNVPGRWLNDESEKTAQPCKKSNLGKSQGILLHKQRHERVDKGVIEIAREVHQAESENHFYVGLGIFSHDHHPLEDRHYSQYDGETQ